MWPHLFPFEDVRLFSASLICSGRLQFSKTEFHSPRPPPSLHPIIMCLKLSPFYWWPFLQLSSHTAIRGKKSSNIIAVRDDAKITVAENNVLHQKETAESGGRTRTSAFIEIAPPDIKNLGILSVHSVHLTPVQKKLKKTVSFQRLKLINCDFYTRDSQWPKQFGRPIPPLGSIHPGGGPGAGKKTSPFFQTTFTGESFPDAQRCLWGDLLFSGVHRQFLYLSWSIYYHLTISDIFLNRLTCVYTFFFEDIRHFYSVIIIIISNMAVCNWTQSFSSLLCQFLARANDGSAKSGDRQWHGKHEGQIQMLGGKCRPTFIHLFTKENIPFFTVWIVMTPI